MEKSESSLIPFINKWPDFLPTDWLVFILLKSYVFSKEFVVLHLNPGLLY